LKRKNGNPPSGGFPFLRSVVRVAGPVQRKNKLSINNENVARAAQMFGFSDLCLLLVAKLTKGITKDS